MKHILSVLVKNSSGVLTHVSSLFSRRGYNIASLSVAETDKPEQSIITMVVDEDDKMIDQVEKQLYKLIDVIQVDDLSTQESLQRELVLVTIKSERKKREEILSLIEVFKATIVDMTEEAIMIELSANPRRIQTFIHTIAEYGIIDMARSGTIALPFLSYQDNED